MKKFLQIIAICLLFGVLFPGCKKKQLEEVVPTYGDVIAPGTEIDEKILERNGVRMILLEEFEDYSESPMGQAYEFLYAAEYVGVYGSRFAKNPQLDLESFSQYNSAEWCVQAEQKDGVWVVEYVDDTQNEPQAMVCAFYESRDAYWMIQAYCPQELFAQCQEIMYACVLTAQILD